MSFTPCSFCLLNLVKVNAFSSSKRFIRSYIHALPTNLEKKLQSERGLNVLGIETSCDDTSVAIVNSNGKVLSNVINSQLSRHLANGGIIPIHARSLHAECIDRVANQAFKESGLSSFADDVDAIAVTNRPGLQFSLHIGIEYARKLAKKYSKPLIPIHHMQAHALMPLLVNHSIKYPFVAFLVSGGHTLLSIAESYNKFYLLGNEIDVACGTVLDKIARRLGLRDLGDPFDKVSGGRAIELLAETFGSNHLHYYNKPNKIPYAYNSNCDFSFSSHARLIDEEIGPKVDELKYGSNEVLIKELADVCASIQRSIVIQLLRKVHCAILYYRTHWSYDHASSLGKAGRRESSVGTEHSGMDILFSGGCSANQYLVDKISGHLQTLDANYKLYAPPRNLCSDNGAMIAWNGVLRLLHYVEGTRLGVEMFDCDINEQVLFDSSQFDQVVAIPKCLIGTDLRDDVRTKKFNLKDYRIYQYVSQQST